MHHAFITGCASGFGRGLALTLLKAGHHVVATDPSEDALADLQAAAAGTTGKLLTLVVDVRDAAQIQAAAHKADAFGPIDLLVNNGGYAAFGTQEEARIDVFADLLDVNVIGVARVTQALLPQIRKTKGYIVNIASVAGRTVFPESGFYAATKHAVEAMSDALLQETGPLGVKVRVVEPGSFNTRFLSTAMARSAPPPEDSPYRALRGRWTTEKLRVLEDPQDPQMVVDAIIGSLDDAPFHRLIVGPDSRRILSLRDQLGPDAFLRLQADRNGLHGPHLQGDITGPEALIQSRDHQLWKRAKAAFDAGQLEHWRQEEAGAKALEALQSYDLGADPWHDEA